MTNATHNSFLCVYVSDLHTTHPPTQSDSY